MTVVPGFIGAHSHPDGVAEFINVNVDLGSIAAVKEALRKKAADTPAGYWVTGCKYDDTRLAEGRSITRRDLVEAVPDHPAMVGHRGGQTGIYNSRRIQQPRVRAHRQGRGGGAPAAGLTSVHRTGMGAAALTAFRDGSRIGSSTFPSYAP